MPVKESLVCENCSSIWIRKVSRGRKPKVCPRCVKDNVIIHDSLNSVPVESSSTKATKWVCPDCGQTVTVFVSLKYPPVCQNPLSHTSRKVQMQIIARQAQIAV
jgi:transposase-like protein